MDIKILYENTDLTNQQIADTLGISWQRVYKYICRHYTKEFRVKRKSNSYRISKLGTKNPMYGKKGEYNPVSDKKGYLMVLKPDWYTGRKNSRHIFEHHYVMCKSLGISEIPRGWCVHHCNRCKTDNRIDNLILMKISDHMKFHSGDNATTISKESTAKWLETYGTPWSDDIV